MIAEHFLLIGYGDTPDLALQDLNNKVAAAVQQLEQKRKNNTEFYMPQSHNLSMGMAQVNSSTSLHIAGQPPGQQVVKPVYMATVLYARVDVVSSMPI